MAYIGNQPASAFASTEKQTITGNGTTGPNALTHEVAAATDIACFVNNVRQEPGVAYTGVWEPDDHDRQRGKHRRLLRCIHWPRCRHSQSSGKRNLSLPPLARSVMI